MCTLSALRYVSVWFGCGRFHPILHDDVIIWKHFPRNWPFVREIHWCQPGHRWISLTKASDAELCYFLWSAPEQTVEQTLRDLKRHHAHYDVIVMIRLISLATRYPFGPKWSKHEECGWIYRDQSRFIPKLIPDISHASKIWLQNCSVRNVMMLNYIGNY